MNVNSPLIPERLYIGLHEHKHVAICYTTVEISVLFPQAEVIMLLIGSVDIRCLDKTYKTGRNILQHLASSCPR